MSRHQKLLTMKSTTSESAPEDKEQKLRSLLEIAAQSLAAAERLLESRSPSSAKVREERPAVGN